MLGYNYQQIVTATRHRLQNPAPCRSRLSRNPASALPGPDRPPARPDNSAIAPDGPARGRLAHKREPEAGQGSHDRVATVRCPQLRKDSDGGDNLEVCQNVSVRFSHLCVFLLATSDFNSPATIINRKAAEFAEPRNLLIYKHLKKCTVSEQ